MKPVRPGQAAAIRRWANRLARAGLAGLAGTAALVLGPPALAQQAIVQRVIVLDSKLFVIAELNSPQQTLDFTAAWNAKVPLKGQPPAGRADSYPYKLDLKSSVGGGRWLYRLDGTVTPQEGRAMPVYRIPDAPAFNRLLGIGG